MKNFTDKNLTSAPCSYFDSLDRFAFEKAAFFFLNKQKQPTTNRWKTSL